MSEIEAVEAVKKQLKELNISLESTDQKAVTYVHTIEVKKGKDKGYTLVQTHQITGRGVLEVKEKQVRDSVRRYQKKQEMESIQQVEKQREGHWNMGGNWFWVLLGACLVWLVLWKLK